MTRRISAQRFHLCILLVVFAWPVVSLAQDVATDDTTYSTGLVTYPPGYTTPFTVLEGPGVRKYIAGVAIGGLFIGNLIDSYYQWWQVRGSGFRFHDDQWLGPNYAGIDKPGHMFGSYFGFHTFYDLLRWGGFEHSTSFWWSAGTTFAMALLIEVGDGMTTLGFDYQDLVFNSIGLSFAMLQKVYPFLNNFRLKWSYVPYEGYSFPPRFTSHYDGLSFWLAFNVNNLLPDAAEPYWPDPIQLAVGMSVVNHYTTWHNGVGKPEWLIGLDFDLGWIPIKQRELHYVQRVINHYHIPMPAVKITEGEHPSWKVFYQQ